MAETNRVFKNIINFVLELTYNCYIVHCRNTELYRQIQRWSDRWGLSSSKLYLQQKGVGRRGGKKSVRR